MTTQPSTVSEPGPSPQEIQEWRDFLPKKTLAEREMQIIRDRNENAENILKLEEAIKGFEVTAANYPKLKEMENENIRQARKLVAWYKKDSTSLIEELSNVQQSIESKGSSSQWIPEVPQQTTLSDDDE